MSHFLHIFVLLLLGASAHAALLGEVKNVRNLPGYIELNKESSFYQGVVSERELQNQIEYRSPSEFISSLFEGDRLSVDKVGAFQKDLRGYRMSAFLIECFSEIGKTTETDCDADGSFKDKWKKNSLKLALDFAESNLKQTLAHQNEIKLSEINSVINQIWVEKIYSAFQVWEAVKSEDKQRSDHSPTYRAIKNGTAALSRTAIARDRTEAANLLVPVGHPLYGKQAFLSEQNLEDLKAKGQDLSLLNPPSTGMWRKPTKSIAEFDTFNYDQSGLGQLRKLYDESEVQAIVDPEQDISVIYKKQHLTGGRTPKFDVRFGKFAFKLKFLTDRHGYTGEKNTALELAKLASGSEANVEPVANNLAAALGYTVDPTYFKKKIRVYFEDEVYQQNRFDEVLKEMIEDISGKYVGAINVPSALRVIKVDERGRKYIEIKTVTLEQKANAKTDLNVGFFHRVHLGKDLAREHRAFFLFLAWIADPDVKNDNSKLKIVSEGDSFKVMESNSDMGAAFGVGFPNVYHFDLIKRVERDSTGDTTKIQFHYPRIFDFPLQNAVNINDAKWFARLLGQLTLRQIERAFLSGGYPDLVAKYYSLLAARKRNELLSALNLIGTHFINDQGRKVSLELLPEFQGTLSGYESYFKDGFLTDPENSLQRSDYENWPRDWGFSRRILNEDPRLQKELGKVFAGDLITVILNASRTFTEQALIHKQGGVDFGINRVLNNSMNGSMGNYFLKGTDIGLRNFMPDRVLVKNPRVSSDPLHPYWMVDSMRIGFFVGDYGDVLKGIFDIPSLAFNAGAGSRIFKVIETIKITPVSGGQDMITHSDNFLNLPKYALRSWRETLVNGLKENETLIATSYSGAEAVARLRGISFPLSLSGLRLSANVKTGNRVLIHLRNQQLFVDFDREKTSEKSFAINAVDLFFKIPLLKEEFKMLKKTEQTFVFNQSEEELAVLHQNLKKQDIASIPLHFRLSERQKQVRERSSLASFLWMKGAKQKIKKQNTDFEDFVKSKSSHTRAYSLASERSQRRDFENAIWEKSADVLVDREGALGLSLNFKLNYPGATKDRFLPVLNQYRSFFPSALFFFDPGYLKFYMGEVRARARIIFTQTMLDKIFDPNFTEAKACALLPNLNADDCADVFYPLYLAARDDYAHLSKNGYQSRNGAFKSLSRFFLNQEKLQTIPFAKAAVGEENLIQYGILKSSLEAFPGQNDEIELNSNPKGLAEHNATLGFQPDLFSDEILNAVGELFFSPMSGKGLIRKSPKALQREAMSE
ncbi:MAG: hypothetical protein H7333_06610 [Bdellovibrionales bacterium]|nr:hypothetical protein [Oligoflexia bacterium]